VTDAKTLGRVGVVGVGYMGGAVARSLLREGFDVVVNDISPEAVARFTDLGAAAAATVEDLAAQSTVVSIVVVSDAQVNDVGPRIIGAAKPGTTVLIHSTVRPSTAVALGQLGAAKGVAVLDVAVNGGNEKADLGKLTLMIGGDADAVARAEPVFRAIGEHVFHIGPLGSGLVGKLVNNLIAIGSYSLQLEAVQLAAAYGIDEETVATVVAFSQGDNRGMRTWGRHDRKRAARAAQGVSWYERMGRDLEEAAVAGGARGVTLPLTAVIAQALPQKLRERDRYLEEHPLPHIPLCKGCDQELAPPFREAGYHPECLPASPS
jgi:3-hydroxyisobutyrate dehydrogenase-like beta-hydroxyacid dehydrogenase